MLKETPLIEEHRRLGAKLISFHGWKLPLEFSGSGREHLNVREKAGLFDVSHMGEIRLRGDQALETLEKCLTNNVSVLKENQAQYNFMCNETGGIIDDLILYCFKPGKDYLLCVNASCLEKDLKWLKQHGLCEISNESDQWAQLALQGPMASSILFSVLKFHKVLKGDDNGKSVLEMKTNQFECFSFLGSSIVVSATGYTGERGFEILVSPEKAPILWRSILEKGEESDCLPVGLAARDTLRMEMKYPLYGNDLNEDIDPHSAGLSWVVKNPHNFIGSAALSRIKKDKKLVGFQLLSAQGVPRRNSRIWVEGEPVGRVTSGAKSPSLNRMIGLGYIPIEYSSPSQKMEVEIHQNPVPAEIVATPFIKK